MTRRAAAHDYSRPGTYHITLHVAEGMGSPLGKVAGDPMAAVGTPDAPRVDLSPIGQMVEHELLTAIAARYPMVAIQDYVVMPDHLHALLVVKSMIISHNGKRLPLGQVVAGFKKGCNRRYWEMTGHVGGQTAPHTALGGLPAVAYKVPSDGTSGRPPLFAPGFCDVMPVDADQLATQRAYIHDNPRSRLLRTMYRDKLMAQRGAITTALTVATLRGYLQRECAPSQASSETLSALEERLLTASTGGSPLILCDSYGDRALLQRRLLPVVCHRCDKARFKEQQARCLEEAAAGAVLVSPRIAKGEQEIVDKAVAMGSPVVLVADNGFPERYHPSAERIDLCAEGRLLLVTPWRNRYRPKGEAITVPECKTMNCIAQALCRQKDDWWKTATPSSVPANSVGAPRNEE